MNLAPADALTLVLAASGAVALVAIVRRSKGGRPLLHPAERPFRPAPALSLLLLAPVLFLVYGAGGMLVQGGGAVDTVAGIAIPLAAAGIALAFARRAVLLPRGSAWWRALMGLVHVWASLPLVYGTFLLCRGLGLPEQPAVVAIRERTQGWEALAVTAVLVAPVAEEVCFRGLLYPALRTRIPARAALLLSSAAFALVHPPAVWLPMGILAAFLAWLVETTGSVIPAITGHVAFNGWNVALLILFQA